MKQVNPVRLDPAAKRLFWKEHVIRFRQSPLSRGAYCRQNGLSPHQMAYWQKRYSRPATDEVSFVALDIDNVQPVAAASTLNLFTPNGYRIEIGRDFDPGTLQKLIAVLEGP